MKELLRRLRNVKHITLAVVYVGLSIVDIALTQILISSGGYKLNPFMGYILGEHVRWAWAIKMVGMAIVILILLRLRIEWPRATKIVFACLIVYMAVICLINGIAVAC